MNTIKVEYYSAFKKIKGKDFLDIDPGTIVRVEEESGAISNHGDILLRTTDSNFPFICLKTGTLWGNDLEDNYIFSIIENTITIN